MPKKVATQNRAKNGAKQSVPKTVTTQSHAKNDAKKPCLKQWQNWHGLVKRDKLWHCFNFPWQIIFVMHSIAELYFRAKSSLSWFFWLKSVPNSYFSCCAMSYWQFWKKIYFSIKLNFYFLLEDYHLNVCIVCTTFTSNMRQKILRV